MNANSINRWKTRTLSNADKRSTIRYFAQGKRHSMQTEAFETSGLWDDESTRILLVELFQNSYDFDELLQKFSAGMYNSQMQRVMKQSQETGENPEDLIKREAFTVFNRSIAKEQLLKALSKLEADELVVNVGQRIDGKERYYSLTTDQGVSFVTSKIAEKFADESLLFHYLQTKHSINVTLYLMKWIEINVTRHATHPNPSIDQLLLLFGRFGKLEDSVIVEYNTIPYDQLAEIYIEYLHMMEDEKIESIDKNLLDQEIYQKLKAMMNSPDPKQCYIAINDKAVIEPTEAGQKLISEIYMNFYKILYDMQRMYIIKTDLVAISLVSSGVLVAKQIIDTEQHDVNRFENRILQTNDQDFHETNVPMPLEMIVQKRRAEEEKKQNNMIIIRYNQLHHQKYKLLKELTDRKTLISWHFITLFIFAAGLYSYEVRDPYWMLLIGSSIGSLAISLFLARYRKVFDAPIAYDSPMMQQKILDSKDFKPGTVETIVRVIKFSSPLILMVLVSIILWILVR